MIFFYRSDFAIFRRFLTKTYIKIEREFFHLFWEQRSNIGV